MNRMHRSIATTLVAMTALLLNTVATPAWASTTSSTGTASPTPVGWVGPAGGAQHEGTVYPLPARHLDSTLYVDLVETCGGANDGIVKLNSACPITITVTTDGTTPVSNANVAITGQGFSQNVTTNASGVAQVTLTFTQAGYYDFTATDGNGNSGDNWVYAPPSGRGVLFFDFSNLSSDVTSFGFSIRSAGGDDSVSDIAIGPTFTTLPAGTYDKLELVATGPSVEYLYEAAPVTITEGAATSATMDGSQMAAVSIAATWNGTAVPGSTVEAHGLDVKGPSVPGNTNTSSAGQATVYVQPNHSYQFTLLGGSGEQLFASRSTQVTTASSWSVNLTDTTAANFTYVTPTTSTPQTKLLWIAPNGDWQNYFTWQDSGTLHMMPGAYGMEGFLQYQATNGDFWRYSFKPAVGDDPASYAAGSSTTMDLTGSTSHPWQINLVAPSQITVGSPAHLEADLTNGSARVIDLSHFDPSWNPMTDPYRLTVASGSTVVAQRTGPSTDWTPASTGSYTFAVALDPGPFPWTGLTDTAPARTLTVTDGSGGGTAPGTYQLVLDSHPLDVTGSLVRPAGTFSLQTAGPDPANTVTPQSLSLTYTFDPSQVTYNAAASYPWSGSFAGDGTNGTIKWTWSAARAGDRPIYPYLAFHVLPSFTGSSIGISLAGTGTDTSGAALTVTPVTQHVNVAVRAVTVSVAVQGGMQANAVITGANSTQNCERLQDGSGDLICLNPDEGTDTILAVAPGALRAETQLNVGATAKVDAGVLTLPFGDLDGDNEVAAADLEYVKNAFGLDSFFTSLADGNLDQEVDIYDLVMTAANQGVAESMPTTGGAVTAAIGNLPVTTTDKTGLVLLVNHQDSVENAWAAWYVNLGRDSTATVSLAGLPRGSWDLYVRLPDGSQAMRAVDISGSAVVNTTIAFPVTP